MSDSAPAIMPIERLGELIEGYWTTQVIRAAAQLQLPDLLEAQSLLPEELAHRAGAHAGSVGRLLRAMTRSECVRSRRRVAWLATIRTAGYLSLRLKPSAARIASRSFLTVCLTEILTISAQCGLMPQASEAPIPHCGDHSGPEPTFFVNPCISQISRCTASRRQI